MGSACSRCLVCSACSEYRTRWLSVRGGIERDAPCGRAYTSHAFFEFVFGYKPRPKEVPACETARRPRNRQSRHCVAVPNWARLSKPALPVARGLGTKKQERKDVLSREAAACSRGDRPGRTNTISAPGLGTSHRSQIGLRTSRAPDTVRRSALVELASSGRPLCTNFTAPQNGNARMNASRSA